MLDCVLLPDVISTMFPSMIPVSKTYKGRQGITNLVTTHSKDQRWSTTITTFRISLRGLLA